jgi:hypothetical protein
LLELTPALAVLDEIFWPEWDSRYDSFDRERDGTCLARMRNGQGDLWYLLVLPNGGAVLRGFDHDSVMSPLPSRRRKALGGALRQHASLAPAVEERRGHRAR